MDVGHLFFGFSGRINRGKYWLAMLVFVAIYVLFAALVFVTESVTLQAAGGMITIVIFISGLAVGIKRLHDRNKSGWYLVLFYIAPLVLFAAGTMLGVTSEGAGLVGSILGLLALAILLWALVELGCLRGTIGRNRYGDDPLSPQVLTPPVHLR